MKKIGFLVLLLLTLLILGGCQSNKLRGVKEISVKDIFNQKEDNYLIYFNRIDCPDCEQSSPSVIQYAEIIKEYDACSTKRKIYVVTLYTESEKPKQGVYIYREYTGEGGQGTDGKYFVNGVTRVEDLYIGSTSSMIAISTNSKGVKVASYVAQGAENVVAQLEAQLNNCYR